MKKYLTERQAQILALHKKGLTITQIGHEAGISRQRVDQILKAIGAVRITQAEKRKKVADLVRARWRPGVCLATLARELSIPVWAVQWQASRMPAYREYRRQVETERKQKVQRMKEFAEQGMNRAKIAETLGLGVSTVRNHFKTLGLRQRKERRSTQEQKLHAEKTRQLISQGKTAAEVARELDLSINQVYTAMRGIGKGLRSSKQKALRDRRMKVKKLTQKGKSVRDCAEILGVSYATVNNDCMWLERNQQL